MERFLAFLLIFVLPVIISVINSKIREQKEIKEKLKKYQNEEDSFTDSRDGQTYRTVQIGDKIWLAENFNFHLDDSLGYENKPKDGEKYGRLYTWEAAKKACPEGWHLPSDDEWWDMIEIYGGTFNLLNGKPRTSIDISAFAGKDSYKALTKKRDKSDSAKFEVIGGKRNSDGKFEVTHSPAYWTISQYADNNQLLICTYSFQWNKRINQGTIYRQFSKNTVCHCRYVKD